VKSSIQAARAVAEVDHLVGELAGQLPEHVVLAGEVLVERRSRAPRPLGDQLDAGVVVPDLAEHLEGGVEDPALGVAAPLADERVRPEGGTPHDPGAVHRTEATI
jgi:hypothetical protein